MSGAFSLFLGFGESSTKRAHFQRQSGSFSQMHKEGQGPEPIELFKNPFSEERRPARPKTAFTVSNLSSEKGLNGLNESLFPFAGSDVLGITNEDSNKVDIYIYIYIHIYIYIMSNVYNIDIYIYSTIRSQPLSPGCLRFHFQVHPLPLTWHL